MTVSDLMEKLSKISADLPVFVSTNDQNGGLSPIKDPEVETYRYDAADGEHHLAWEHENPDGECVVLSPTEYV